MLALARRAWLVALLALVAGALTVPSALAAPLAGSAYDTGDGDQENGGAIDWRGAALAGAVKESPDANDDCFVGGVKELAPNGWAFNRSAGGCTPGKSNLRVAFANPETTAATSFGHFAFFRNDTTGNTFLTFELNQESRSWTNATGTTIPCRSTGDLLLSFEVGGSSLTTSLYRWRGDGTGPAACPDGAAGTFTGSGTIPAGRFQGGMNSAAAIANAVNAGTYGATFPANAFGEAAIDIPAVLRSMGQRPCFAFLQMQVHSRSSSSISSAMIDYTTPTPVHVQSCAAIGTQYQDVDGDGTRDAGEPGVAGVRAYADLDDDGVHDAGEPSGVSDATGFYRIVDMPAGTHRIRSVPRAGWRCSQPSPCSYSRTFVADGNSTGNDFGAIAPATASGTAFDDRDGDGTRDLGEPGLTGAVAYADLDGDAVRDADEPAGTAGTDGAFTVADVPIGTHTLRLTGPDGIVCTAPVPCSASREFVSGTAVTGLLFGGYRPASVSGRVYEDVDGDGGTMAAGDTALAGRQVFADADGDDTFDLGERQTATDATGRYVLTGLAPGTAVVRASGAAETLHCTRPATTSAGCERALTLTSGDARTDQDFGLARGGTVSGLAFDDVDGAGDRDGSDPGIAGFTHFADYDGDTVRDADEPAATSDATGAYSIVSVRPGTWTLRQAPNGAYACTTPSPCTYTVTLTANGVVTGRTFGDYVSRSVSGTVYDDADADGLVAEAGERGLGGWVVFSDQVTKNGQPDAGEPQATTNDAGQYRLVGLSNGNYSVRMQVRSGWTCSAPAGCENTGSIGSGQSDTGKHFGVYGPKTVTGALYEDADGDGTGRQPGDAPLSGRTVFADANGNAAFDAGEPSATTDADGAYAIVGLAPGTHTIRQVLPPGWTCTRPVPCTQTVATAGGQLTGRNFASRTTGRIAGTVHEDADADAAAGEAGEGVLSGRTVFLDTNGSGGHDAGEPQTTTDGAGRYAFPALAPGTYRVRQVLPAGWTQTVPAAEHLVVLTSSAAVERDFAAHTTGAVRGTVFDDTDFDGSARTGADAGVPGHDVYADADGDGVHDPGEPRTTTGADGGYALAGLRPGRYVVRPVLPAATACAFPADCAATVTVVSGATVADRDFGTYVGATISGSVFEDADGDGAAREPGDGDVAGQRVYLDGDGDAVRDATEPTTLTGADGGYAFAGVTATSWTVRLAPVAGVTCDRPDPCVHVPELRSGSAHPGQDFGVHRAGTISGHLFTDRDADGSEQRFGENDQPERTVFLDGDGDGVHDDGEPSAETDDRGDFRLTGVEPGTHRVRPVLPAGWICSTPADCVREVTVSSGQAVGSLTFSSWTTASFTGTYFEDLDADGEYPEPGERRVASRTVFLDGDRDGLHDGDEPETTTEADGDFAFSGLRPGSYVVRPAAQPDAWTCSYPSTCAAELTLEAAERAQDVDFGAYTTGAITGRVTDPGDADAGLAGRTVYVDVDGQDDHDPSEPSATTDTDGAYRLVLAPGEHAVRTVVPGGWTCTSPAGCERRVTVVSQDTTAAQDFATVRQSSVSGVAYTDTDADGTRGAGEPARAGLVVFADADDDGTHDAGEPSATSGADGAFSVATGAGTHTIRPVLPAGLRCAAPDGCAHVRTLTTGASATGADFGVWEAASVSGHVREDTDGDGAADAALPGRTVFADLDGDGTAGAGEPTATSAADGTFTVAGLRPGTRRVVLAPAPGSTCSAPDPCSQTRTLTSGEQATGAAFTVWRAATIHGVVGDDTDGDGTRDAGEPALPGLTVFADADGDGRPGPGEPRATTDGDGAYALTGLMPGEHLVRVAVGDGWTCGTAASCSGRVRVAGAGDATHDVAAWDASTISGLVFGDLDADGAAREAGEPGVGGRTVFADTDGDGTRDDDEPRATTAEDGTYALTGVRPGTHVVRLVAVAGARCTRPDPCTDTVTTTSGSAPAAAAFGVVAVAADLRVALERTTPDPVAGRAAAWRARVVNDGPLTAHAARLVVDLPAGLREVRWTAPDGVTCTRAGDTLTCPLGDLASGADRTLVLEGVVAPDQGGRTLPVVVRTAADEPDPDPSDDRADEAPAVGAVTDLRAAAQLPPRADTGTVVDLVLEARNDGPSDAAALELTATLPDGLDAVAARLPAGCTVTGRRVTCAVAALGVGGTVRRTVPVAVGPAATGTLSVPVTVRAATPDPTPADAEVRLPFVAEPVADVRVAVDEEPRDTPEGVAYAISVRSTGPSPATEVVLHDGPFPGTKVVSATPSHGTCAVLDDGRLRCDLGTLPAGTVANVVVVLALDEGQDRSSVRPTPSARAREADPTPADNRDDAVLRPDADTMRPRPSAPAAPAPAPAAPRPAPVATPAPAPVPLPVAKTCVSRRLFPIRLRVPRGDRLASARVFVNGRRVPVQRTDRARSTIHLAGLPKGRFRVRIAMTLRSGRVVRGTRTYHTCIPKRPTRRPPPI